MKPSDIIYVVSLVLILLAVLMAFTSFVYAEISVTQSNLTESEQNTLDDIAEARENGTCTNRLCIPLTANITTQRLTLEVTIPHTISENNPEQPCQTQTDGFVPVTICMWRGVAPDGSEPIYDHVEEKWTSVKILEQEAKEAYDIFVEAQLDKQKPYWETVSDRLPDDPKSNANRVLVDKVNQLLEAPSECYQGRGTTNGLQEVRAFDIPVVEVPVYVTDINGDLQKTSQTKWVLDETMPLSNIDIRGFLATIYKNVRECAAQMILDNPQGGIYSSTNTVKGFCDNVDGELTVAQSIKAGCGITSGSFHKDLIEDTPNWSQSRVNAEANMDASLQEVNPMCTSYNSDSTKRDYGCDISIGYLESTRSTPEMTDHGKEIEAKFNQYKIDDGASMRQDIIDQIRADDYNRLK